MEKNKFKENNWIYFTARYIFKIVFKIFWRCEIVGHENIPKEGAVIIAPNHVSLADPPIVGSSVQRPMFFMAKQELFDGPVKGFIMHRTNSFPVRRGEGDVGAFKTILRLLKRGEAVLVFPEGGRSKDGNFQEAKPGLGMFACMTQSPVIPVRVINSLNIWSFKRIKVIFGKVIYPPKEYDKGTYLAFSKNVLEEIKKL